MIRYWLSFYTPSMEFAIYIPWWVCGYRDDDRIVCAAIIAENEEAAWERITRSFDKRSVGRKIERRFANEMEPGWNPFSERFPINEWMRHFWPDGNQL